MRYQHLKTTRKLQKYLVPILPIVIAGVLVFGKVPIPAFLTNATHALASPFWVLRDTLQKTSDATKTSFKGRETLVEENRVLLQELSQLRREVFLTRTLLADNNRLHGLLDRTISSESLVSASVIHGERFSPYDTFIVDLGADDGVRSGMLVVTPEGIAVGTISTTQEKTATVTQFSAPDMVVDAMLNATSSFHTVLRGYGSGTMRVSIPRDIEFAVDDIFVLPSFSTYPIGKIVSIEVAPEDAYKILYIRSPVNMYELRYVLIDTTTVWKQPEMEDVTEPQVEIEPEPENIPEDS
jgi:cell shape-determining protein MreC